MRNAKQRARYVYLKMTTAFTGSCSNPMRLGVEDGRVQDSQITVSSFMGESNSEIAVRLNRPNIDGLYAGAWRAANADQNPWVQVDFLRPVTITGVITQGRENRDHWVTTYELACSDDGITWTNDGTVGGSD
jgi:hypothetical protein